VTIPIVDTGPLVAFVSSRDRHHAWAKAQLGALRPPLYTCDAVLSEASFLLARGGMDASVPVAMLARGLLDSSFRLSDHGARVSALMRRYADQPMSLADGCLVGMTELHSECILLTLDSDFEIYRRHGRQKIPLRIP
jgi:predicted nucleic acid-binding protein